MNPGGQLLIGSIVFNKGKSAYTLSLADEVFSDHFLSMRPFKCLTDPASQHASKSRMLCHLPYPYKNRRRLAEGDYVDLEYDLLFIARSDKEYGIDPWHGRYFRLRWHGNTLTGAMQEVDLNVLAAPPEAGNLRPITYDDLTPAEKSDSKWTPSLLITPVYEP